MKRISERIDRVKHVTRDIPPAVLEEAQNRIEDKEAKIRAAGLNPSVISVAEADKILKS